MCAHTFITGTRARRASGAPHSSPVMKQAVREDFPLLTGSASAQAAGSRVKRSGNAMEHESRCRWIGRTWNARKVCQASSAEWKYSPARHFLSLHYNGISNLTWGMFLLRLFSLEQSTVHTTGEPFFPLHALTCVAINRRGGKRLVRPLRHLYVTDPGAPVCGVMHPKPGLGHED